MKKIIPVDLLERYLTNKCTPEEKTLVKDWYQSLEQEHDYISDLDETEEQRLEEEIYNHILSNIGETDEQTSDSIPVKSLYLKIGYVAATIAAIFLIYVAVAINYKKTKNDDAVTDGKCSQIFVIKNSTKQIYKTTLPDSSIVWLSPGASIRYPQIFEPKYRMITLSGESFFEVTKNPQRPFIINSHSIITKVWGTSFLVHDDVNGKMAEVSVVTGKVSVSIRNKPQQASTVIEKGEVLLYPNQKVTFLKTHHSLKTEKENNDASLKIWNRINFSFDNIALKNLVPVLNEKFNVHLVVVNERLNNYVLDADFTGFNLPDVLEALKKTLNINYELNNNNNIELK
ncbi:MAG: FecR family protein [Mucilaginibacter sp.]|uniref:FecR family protein n=1 Tax=Mucilaginibacter sp. TaxID=1882438 RepID=UPI0031ACA0DD